MNILLLLTGGTICSFENENGERVSDTKKAQALIVKNFKKSSSEYRNTHFKTVKVLNVLSENMTVTHWNTFIKKFKKYDLSLYDGVIILHGTDTLAYTSSLLSMLLAGTKIPIMLVSSAQPIYEKNANGNENFKASVELIAKGISPNVYAVYQNTDGITYLHLGSHLLQCQNGSCDFFSCGMSPVDKASFNTKASVVEMPVYSLEKLLPDVLYLTPYTGINYSLYSLRGVRAVLHGTYHSQTAAAFPKNSRHSLIAFKKKCDKFNVPLFLCPCDSEAYDYETTGEILRHGAVGISNITTETAYAKILIGVSTGLTGDALKKYISTEINGEFIKNS